MTLGEVIKRLRKQQELTQAQLADLLGERLGLEDYNQSNITRIENNKYDVPLSMLQALSDVFGLSLADITALMEISPQDPQLSSWLAAYKRLTKRQRAAVLDFIPEK